MSPFLKGDGDSSKKRPSGTDKFQDGPRKGSAGSSVSDLALTPNSDAFQPESSFVAEDNNSSANDYERSVEPAIPNESASRRNSSGGMLSRSRSDYALNVMTTNKSNATEGGAAGDATSDAKIVNDDATRDKGKAPMRRSTGDGSSGSDSSSSSSLDSETGKAPARERITTNAATGKVDIHIDYDDPDVILPDPLPTRRKGGLPTAGGVPLGGGARAKRLASDGSNRLEADIEAPNQQRSLVPNPLQTLHGLTGIDPYKEPTQGERNEASLSSAAMRKMDTPNRKMKKTSIADHRAEVAYLEARGTKRDHQPGEQRSYRVARSRRLDEYEVELLRWIQRNFQGSRTPHVVAESSSMAQQRAARSSNRQAAVPYGRSGAVGARNSVPFDSATRQAVTERQPLLSPTAVSNLGVLPEVSPDSPEVENSTYEVPEELQSFASAVTSNSSRRHTEPAAARRPSTITEQSEGQPGSDQGSTHSPSRSLAEQGSRPTNSTADLRQNIRRRRVVDFAPRPYRHNGEAFHADLPELNPRERARNSMTNFYIEMTHRKSLVASTIHHLATHAEFPEPVATFAEQRLSGLRRFSASYSLFGNPNDPPRGGRSGSRWAWRSASGRSLLGGRDMTSSERVGLWETSEEVAPDDTSALNPNQSTADGAGAPTTPAAAISPGDAAIPNATRQDVEFALSPAATTQAVNDPHSTESTTRQMSDPTSPGGSRPLIETESAAGSRQSSIPTSPEIITVRGTDLLPPTYSAPNHVHQTSEPTSPGGSRQSSIPTSPEIITVRGTDFVPPTHPHTNYENVRPRTHMGAGSSGTPLEAANQPHNMRNPRGWINTQLAVEMEEAEMPIGEGSSKAASETERDEAEPIATSPTAAAAARVNGASAEPQHIDMPTVTPGLTVASNLDGTTQDATGVSDDTPRTARVGAGTGPLQAADPSTTSPDLTVDTNIEDNNAQDIVDTADRAISVRDGAMVEVTEDDSDNAAAAATSASNDVDQTPTRRRSSWFIRGRDSIIALPKKTMEAMKNLATRRGSGGQQTG